MSRRLGVMKRGRPPSPDLVLEAIREAVLVERERCARICSGAAESQPCRHSDWVAAAEHCAKLIAWEALDGE